MTDTLLVLREPAVIRARCGAVARAAAEGRSAWWRIDRGRLDEAAARVQAVIARRFPDLRIPLHSRWRHFEAGGVDRKAELDARLQGLDAEAQARARIDLTMASVLLDAGAGAAWRFRESGRGDAVYTRSEGLAVATLRAFSDGAFSADPGEPLRVDASALRAFDVERLGAMFQVDSHNPLVGLEGRAGLMARLGEALAAQAARDGLPARPGSLFDRLTDGGVRTEVDATALLRELLATLAPVWRGGAIVLGQPAGDVWPHRWAGDAVDAAGRRHPESAGWVPFHKLTQWLAYSLVEPLQWAGVAVTGLDALTGLPEYRNGGLLVDTGVVVPREPRDLGNTWKPGDEFVVEWRALTVVLLDELAARVRERLGAAGATLPLAALLEGGTWVAGREIAAEKRAGGAPPFAIASDGTVF